jgi:hypothetical protein
MGQSALTAVTRTQGATRALKDGSVRPAGWTDLMHQRVAQITGADPMPYSVAPTAR